MTESAKSVPIGLPRPFLRPLLMISLAKGPSHGYELTERLQTQGLHMVDTAAIYRMLRGMEHESLVESWWETSASGPHRRVYILTALGQAEARDQVKELTTIRGLLDEALSAAAGISR